MASPTEPVAACERALAAWGTIDILVNSAGIANVAPAVDFSTEDWDRMMAVNLRAPFLTARTLAPRDDCAAVGQGDQHLQPDRGDRAG